jgi:membrane protease subunit HflK
MMKQISKYPMAWNEPGGDRNGKGNNQNPWGRGKGGEQGPPDLEQIIKRFIARIKQWMRSPSAFGKKSGTSGPGFGSGSGSGSSSSFGGNDKEMKSLLIGAASILVVLYIAAGIYIVDPPERAVVTRFGKYVCTQAPGPHWLPVFIESKEVVNVEQVSTSDHSGLMLTRDRNIASVGVAVQYRIGSGDNDLRSYLFNVVNPVRSLKMSAESALRQVIGQSTMDEVLTLKRAEIALAIKQQLIETLKGYQTGLEVIDVAMQFAKAPDEVRAAFDDVIKAAADEERLVNQARAYENEILPRARGTVERLKNEALGYKQEKVLLAEGYVERFNSIVTQYQKAPKVTQTRLYLETMEQVLSNVSKVVVDTSLGNNLIYLPFDKLIPQAEKEAANANVEPSTTSTFNSSSSVGSTSTGSAYQKEKL